MQQDSKVPRSQEKVLPLVWEMFVQPLFAEPSETWEVASRQVKVQAAAGDAARRAVKTARVVGNCILNLVWGSVEGGGLVGNISKGREGR